MKAVGMAAWAAFALLVAGSVAAQQLETEDGLAITLAPEGSATSLATEGRSWAVAQGAPSGGSNGLSTEASCRRLRQRTASHPRS